MRRSQIQVAAWLLGAIGVVASIASALTVAAPSVSPDEWGYLLNGQVLLGRHESVLPFAKFYGPVYGLVSALGSVLTGSLQGSYRFDLVVNCGLNVLTGVLCGYFAHRMLKASMTVALLAGVMVAVSPGGFGNALFAWSETLGRLSVVMLFILVWHAASAPSPRRVSIVAVTAGFLPFVHGRFVAFVGAVLVLFVVWALQRHISVALVSVGVAILVGAYAVGRGASAIMRGWLYRGSGAQEFRLLRRLVDPSLLTDIARETGGQLWYALAASFGLVFVAVVWMCKEAFTSSSGRSGRTASGNGAVAFLALLGSSGIVLLGSLQLARAERGDQFIYGRHVEAFLPIFLVVGMVEVSKVRDRVHRMWLAGASSIAGVAIVYTAAQRQDIVHQWVVLNGPLKTANILAVDAMADVVGNEGLLSLGILFAMTAIVVLLLHRMVKEWALVAMACLALASSVWTARTTMVERSDLHRSIGATFDLIPATRGVTVGYDGASLHDKRYFAFRYALHPVQVKWLDRVNGDLTVPDDLVCLYGFADRAPGPSGWRIIGREDAVDRVLWSRSAGDSC